MWLPLAISQGLVPGHKNEYHFGFNPSVGVNEETVWDLGGIYTYPPNAGIEMALSSSSADDASAGTGAQSVEIIGLDENFDEFNTIVETNGQTAVAIPGLCSRIFRAIVRTTGTGTNNAGTLFVADAASSLTAGVPPQDETFTSIGVGENQTLEAFYTVPKGHTGHLYFVQASSFGNPTSSVTVRFCFRNLGQELRVQDKFTVTQGQVILPHDTPLFLPEMTDIECRAVSSAAGVECAASFGLVVIRDGLKQSYLI